MAPPPALRKRSQEQQATPDVHRLLQAKRNGGAGRPGAANASRRLLGLIAACAVVGVIWFAATTTMFDSALDEPPTPEVQRLLQAATTAIHKSYDYPHALGLLERAYDMAPRSSAVLQLYASVLNSQQNVSEAYRHLHTIFNSRSKVAKDLHFLQLYVLSLHRLEKKEELKKVWPRITSTSGVSWRNPLQCPDMVDESLLDGAVPFPDHTNYNSMRLLMRSVDNISAEFDEFRSRPDWDSAEYFKPNQDNDLVSSNEPARWSEMTFFEKGQWQPRTCALMPTVCKVLRLPEIEGIVHGRRSGQVSLLKLEPGTTLVPHFGSVNWRFVAHLGLLVPENVTMKAGDEKRNFEHKKIIVLDDSFLHSVNHGGDGVRVTLFINFFHPESEIMSYDEWQMSRR